jgi:hypothetical protein
MLKSLVFALGLTAMATSSLVTSAPASADDKMATKIDCTQAGSMMTDAAKMGSSTAMTGDVDKDFMATAMEHEKGTNMMMKIEAACGKDPKMKSMAEKAVSDSDARMQMFRNMNTSQ